MFHSFFREAATKWYGAITRMPSTSSDPPAAAGTGGPIPRTALHDGDAEQRERMWSMAQGYLPENAHMYRHRTPQGIKEWLDANPEVRTDSPAFPNNPGEDPERRHWIFEESLAYTVLKRPSGWQTPGLLDEVLRRIVDFDRKDKNGKTLFQVLKQNRKREGLKKLTEEMERRAAETKRQKEALIALPGLKQVARNPDKPISEDIEHHIARFLTGEEGTIDAQRNTLRNKLGMPSIGKGRRKTRRTKQNKSRRRGAQR